MRNARGRRCAPQASLRSERATRNDRPGIGMARAPLRLVRVTRRARHAPSACDKPRAGLSLCNIAKGGSQTEGQASLRSEELPQPGFGGYFG